jgi:hypothetical protein
MLQLHRDATFVLDDFSELDWGELQTLKDPAWRGLVLSSGKQALSWPEGFTSLQISVVNLPGDPPVSRELLTAAQRDYGWALREFLARLVQEDREEMQSKLDDELINFSFEMEDSDALDHFALLASAGEWATWWGITGWELGTAKDALHYCYDWWRESLNGGARRVQYRFCDLEAYQAAHRRLPRSTQNASGDEAV